MLITTTEPETEEIDIFPRIAGEKFTDRMIADLRPSEEEWDAFYFIYWLVSQEWFDEAFPQDLDEETYRANAHISTENLRKSLWCGIQKCHATGRKIDIRHGDSAHFDHIIPEKVINIFRMGIYRHHILDNKQLLLARAKRLLTHPLNVVPMSAEKNREKNARCIPEEVFEMLRNVQELYREHIEARTRTLYKNKITGRSLGTFEQEESEAIYMRTDPDYVEKIQPFCDLLRVRERSEHPWYTMDAYELPDSDENIISCHIVFHCNCPLFAESIFSRLDDAKAEKHTQEGRKPHRLGLQNIDDENAPMYTIHFTATRNDLIGHNIESLLSEFFRERRDATHTVAHHKPGSI